MSSAALFKIDYYKARVVQFLSKLSKTPLKFLRVAEKVTEKDQGLLIRNDAQSASKMAGTHFCLFSFSS